MVLYLSKMQLLTLPNMYALLPLPCTALALQAAKVDPSNFESTWALVRQCSRVYDHVVVSIQSALLQGTFCPGLDCIAQGLLRLDGFRADSLEAQVLRWCGATMNDAGDLSVANGPSGLELRQDMNSGAISFVGTASLLTECIDTHALWLRPAATTAYFVVFMTYQSFRLALLFREPVMFLD